MLDFFIVNKTKAIPYAVYGGKVCSFQMPSNKEKWFDGRILKVSNIDGFVYAVFENSTECEDHDYEFQDCQVSCFDGYMNAYCISR